MRAASRRASPPRWRGPDSERAYSLSPVLFAPPLGPRSGSLLLLGSAQHGRGRDRGIAGLDPDIDHRDVARLDRRNRLLEGRHQILRLGDGIEADRALRLAEPGAIDVGIGDALTDPAVLWWPVADARDALLVQLVIEERAIVADHDQQRDAVVHRSPQRSGAHAEVAVAADGDRKPPGALKRQRRADRNAGPAADAAAALRADIVERMMERPGGAVPRQRKVSERHRPLADRSLE